MNKKLYYGGQEVVVNDPRLPEILADIVALIDRALDRKVTLHGGMQTEVTPSRYFELDEGQLARLKEKEAVVSTESAPVFKYKGEIYLNVDNTPVAECLKQPGLKVVESED